MGLPPKQVHVRLSADQMRRLTELQERFAGLPPSTVVRFIIASVLDQSIEDQTRIVSNQITGKPLGIRRSRSALNARSRTEE